MLFPFLADSIRAISAAVRRRPDHPLRVYVDLMPEDTILPNVMSGGSEMDGQDDCVLPPGITLLGAAFPLRAPDQILPPSVTGTTDEYDPTAEIVTSTFAEWLYLLSCAITMPLTKLGLMKFIVDGAMTDSGLYLVCDLERSVMVGVKEYTDTNDNNGPVYVMSGFSIGSPKLDKVPGSSSVYRVTSKRIPASLAIPIPRFGYRSNTEAYELLTPQDLFMALGSLLSDGDNQELLMSQLSQFSESRFTAVGKGYRLVSDN